MTAIELKNKLDAYYQKCLEDNERCNNELCTEEFLRGLALCVMKISYWIEHDQELDDMAYYYGEPYEDIQ